MFQIHVSNTPSSSAPTFNIYGHTPRDEVLIGENFVSLDTGCGRGEDRKLSAYCVETKEIVSVGCVCYANK